MTDLINRTDDLNTGREKLNEAIKDADKAKIDAEQALNTANEALSQSESTQTQLDQIVIDGDSSVEAAQARIDAEGNVFTTLKERLDIKETDFTSQLIKKAEKEDLENIASLAPKTITDHDMTSLLQDFFDAMPDGTTIRIPPGRYIVSKNSSLPDFPKNDQPCLLIRNKKNIKIIANGVIFKTNTHAQGILEFQLSENIEVEGLRVEGYDAYPALDGTTGRGEKGTVDAGYPTQNEWGFFKNNSKNLGHGIFGGGYIGNIGVGVLVHRGCKNITFINCEAEGFNYSGFGVGHNGDFHPINLGYEDSENIIFQKCIAKNNYSSNFHFLAVNGAKMIDCYSESAGHPDAMYTDYTVDPGYGVALIGSNWSNSKNVEILNSLFIDNKRKGIDAHGGIGIKINKNRVINSIMSGIFLKATSDLMPVRDVVVTENTIIESSFHKDSYGALRVGGVTEGNYTKENAYINGLIKNNQIIRCGNGIIAGPFDTLNVSDNIIDDIDDRAITPYTGIRMGTLSPSERNYNGIVNGNTVNSRGKSLMIQGVTVRYLNEGVVNDNTIILENNAVSTGLYLISCGQVNALDNYAKLLNNGTAVADTQTEGKTGNIGIGGTPSVKTATGQVIHFLITANGGNGDVLYFTGANLVDSIVSSSRGLQINLKNVSKEVRPFVSHSFASSEGLKNASDVNQTYIYNRSANDTTIEIGIKPTITATSHTPFNLITSGSLEVRIDI